MLIIPKIDTKILYVGFSGGVDSSVLLHSLVLSNNYKVIAVHVNHNLQHDAHEHCKIFCLELGVQMINCNISGLASIKNNKENAYRKSRYKAFLENIPKGGYLALAHHQDDQIETRIKRIMTASSKTFGMQEHSIYESINIIRPLLKTSKEKILNYAKINKLQWIEDPSNKDITFERNNIRRNIMPKLKSQWPGINRSIDTFVTKHENLNKISEELSLIDLDSININGVFNLYKLKSLSESRRINCWLKILEIYQLDFDYIAGIDLMHKCLKNSTKIIDGVHWVISGNKAWFQSHMPKLEQNIIWANLNQEIDIELGKISFQLQGNIKPPNDNEVISIRSRLYGQSINLDKKSHSQKIKKLMQEWSIPKWQRDAWPLIYYNEKLVCIPKYAIARGYYQKNGCNFNLEIVNKVLKPQEFQ